MSIKSQLVMVRRSNTFVAILCVLWIWLQWLSWNPALLFFVGLWCPTHLTESHVMLWNVPFIGNNPVYNKMLLFCNATLAVAVILHTLIEGFSMWDELHKGSFQFFPTYYHLHSSIGLIGHEFKEHINYILFLSHCRPLMRDIRILYHKLS